MPKTTSTTSTLNERIVKRGKLLFILILFILVVLSFLGSIFHTALTYRKVPTLIISESNRALRGSIVSQDDFTLDFSKKLYKAMVNTHNIDPDKKELFIKLFSVYSGINTKTVRNRLKTPGNVVLSYSIDANRAKYLKELARKFRLMHMFQAYKEKNGHLIKYGLSLTESGESRIFPYHDMLMPILGYMKKIEDGDFTRPVGVKGIEKYYQDALAPAQNGLIRGERDIGNTIILDKDSFVRPTIGGMTLRLNIPIDLQKSVEMIADNAKSFLDAREVIACVMDARTGKIRALATSNRYDPAHITRRDYPSLNVAAIEYTYEPGSVMKPMTFSMLLQHHKVNPYDIIRTYNGRYKLGKRWITDDHKAPWLSAENVIVYSSNIGMAQLAQRLDAMEFINGLKSFGFTRKTGIDLPYEHTGIMPNIRQMESETYKGTVGYGYGIRVTFMQLMRAYNMFNDGGRLIEPKIVNHITTPKGKRYIVQPMQPPKQVLPPATALMMKHILEKVVQKGTGTRAQTPGITVGGKTGTAHISGAKGRGRGYKNIYNSSFFGFADDKKHSYTIGVLVREAKKPYYYYASMSAVPVFKKIVDLLIEQGRLTPSKADASNP